MDNYEWSWVLASQVVKDTGISRGELWEIIQKVKIDAFLDCIATNLPGAEGLLSVTITKRGRLFASATSTGLDLQSIVMS